MLREILEKVYWAYTKSNDIKPKVIDQAIKEIIKQLPKAPSVKTLYEYSPKSRKMINVGYDLCLEDVRKVLGAKNF